MPALPRLINAAGQPSYGLFPDGVEEINYLDFDLRSVMDKPRSQLAKRFGANQFQFISLLSAELVVGVAIVDLKFLSNAFVYLYDPRTQRFDEFSFMQPLARNTRIEPRPDTGLARFEKGGNQITIDAAAEPGVRRLQVALADGTRIDARIDEAPSQQPLSVCARAGYAGWVFTRKTAARVCSGSVSWRGQRFDLRQIGALAAVDWTAGFMRRETFWNWGSLSCRLPDGRRLGFNLAAGVNETGFTENGLWLDEQLIKVDMVDFQFDRSAPLAPWQLRSADGQIDLQFAPVGCRQEKRNALLLASNFKQHFGQYSGVLRLPGETLQIADAWGLVEDHYARW
ncbi:DUF2804 domain-containing protein [Halopseudomonas maritima]|uniref:DUF2804 domain-containing protein n=1 Tax=Halopseudomonas maritima TaxID=2918528 RepID=UPI001EEA17EF|nr:DUF2804 domain-containing protein [Halopseudomonas maritima]UJJ32224.1 DUF2804 domain-containing protein [Halopseudomonas maritima]